VAKGEVRERVERAARTLSISELLDRKPAMLSGGQRQRVAIGRAIVRDPAVFLMDEPLSNLDAKLRGHMRAELTMLHRELRATVLYVTHDQVEAMTMGNRVAVMWRGIIQQVAPPAVLYEQPVNLFVASFIGAPAMNFLQARLTDEEGGLMAHAGALRLPLDARWATDRQTLRQYIDREVVLGVRPEHLDSEPQGDASVAIDVTVDVVEALGYEKLVYFHAEAPRGRDAAGMLDGGTENAASRRVEFCARVGPARTVPEGRAQLFVEPRRLQVFDPDTGAAIGVDPRATENAIGTGNRPAGAKRLATGAVT
jgi:multiple sugar transport system ATP-binding protein